MAGSTISGTITSTVTLGSASYPSPLTVATTGDVAVTVFSAIGLYGPAGAGTLLNDGTIIGGAGTSSTSQASFGGNGGTGVDLLGGNTATNNGAITGGAGGVAYNAGGNGGAGVYLAAGAALTNQGAVTGGRGGAATIDEVVPQPSGGAGAYVKGGTLTNAGNIVGGAYYRGHQPGPFDLGYGGSGVLLLAGMLTNTGTITGGRGRNGNNPGGTFTLHPRADVGVYLSAGASLANTGTIIGGYFSGAGIFMSSGGALTVAGVVTGGAGDVTGGVGVYLASGGSVDSTAVITGGAGGDYGGTGVDLASGGTLINAATIIGGRGTQFDRAAGLGGSGVSLASGGVLINTGSIAGGQGGYAQSFSEDGRAGGDGADLTNGGTLSNSASAMITGGMGGRAGGGGFGVYGGTGGGGVSITRGSLANAGAIIGGAGGPDGNGGTGVSLSTLAVVTNTGTISGGGAGYAPYDVHGGMGVVMGATSSATLVNSGLINGGNGYDVAPGATNALNARVILGGGGGAFVGSGDTLTNSGSIIAGVGVFVGAGGAFNSKFGGTITGGAGITVATGGMFFNTGTVISGVGVYLAAGATLTTGGTTAGGIYAGITADAVRFAASGTLVLDPGASFIGQVAGNAGSTDALYFAYYGSNNGTLTGLGAQFTDFSQIIIAADASWTLTGANTIGSGATLTELSGASLTATGTLLNDGAIVLDPSTLTVAGLTGTGSVAIDAGSTLAVQTTIAAGETLTFSGSGGYLHLGTPDDVAGSMTNFSIGDTIDLQGIALSSVSYSAALGQLTFSGGGFALALAPDGGSVSTAASADGTEVFSALCFCANTQILTPQGERAVQDLAVGDLVTTHRGEARAIVWVGEGRVRVTRGQRNAATPVIVRKGALAENVPHRDLRVTKGHSLWFGGGVLIPVEYLVNHRLIEWDDRAQEVSLYHIELASHDVLVANGAPAESYRDDGNRWLFENANSGWARPPQAPCAPVLTGGPVVDAVWRRLLERAGPRPGFALTDDPDLHLVVDGARVDAGARRGAAAYVFCVPGWRESVRAGAVRIVSRAGAPAELGVARDPRVLGVAVRRIVLRQKARFRVVEAAELAGGEGFYPFEQGDGVRWTDGDAVLPEELFAGFEGAVEVVVHVGGTTRYPLIGAGDWGCGVAA